MKQTSLIIGLDNHGGEIKTKNKDLNDMLSEGWHVVMMEAFSKGEGVEGHILVILQKD